MKYGTIQKYFGQQTRGAPRAFVSPCAFAGCRVRIRDCTACTADFRRRKARSETGGKFRLFVSISLDSRTLCRVAPLLCRLAPQTVPFTVHCSLQSSLTESSVAETQVATLKPPPLASRATKEHHSSTSPFPKLSFCGKAAHRQDHDQTRGKAQRRSERRLDAVLLMQLPFAAPKLPIPLPSPLLPPSLPHKIARPHRLARQLS